MKRKKGEDRRKGNFHFQIREKEKIKRYEIFTNVIGGK